MNNIKPEVIITEVAVIGGGPAGMAAALVAEKEGTKVTIIERDFELGGILQQCIHNGFGLKYFKEELTGPEYAQRFIDQIKNSTIQVLLDSMVIDLAPDKTITVLNSKRGLIKIRARAVILGMGCRERTRGAICIPGTRPSGVYTAGMAQRLINMEGYIPGRRVVILGSGDIGLIMARRLTLEGITVVCVSEIQPYCVGLIRNKVQCLDDYDIPLHLHETITSIRGTDRVEGVVISKVDDRWIPIPGTEKLYDCDTVLFSVGLIPENEISLKADITLDITNGPCVNEYLETNDPGIFAAGNALQVHDLVDWVTLEAERAGKFAADYVNYIERQGKLMQPIKIKPGNNVLYTIPQRIDYLDEEKTIQFSFRPKNPDKECIIEFSSSDEVFYSKKVKHVIPSELLIYKVKISPDEVENEIIINIYEKPSDIEGEKKEEDK